MSQNLYKKPEKKKKCLFQRTSTFYQLDFCGNAESGALTVSDWIDDVIKIASAYQ